MIQNTMTTTHVHEDGMLVMAGTENGFSEEVDIAVLEEESAGREADDALFGIPGLKAARKKQEEDDEEDDDDDDNDVEEGEGDDDWEESDEEEEDEWDPDFDEFDIPKSTKKGNGGKDEEDEEMKFDEDLNEFDDLFSDGGDEFDDDDDF